MTTERVSLFKHLHRRRHASALPDYHVPTSSADWFVWASMAFGVLVIVLTVIGLWLAGQP